MLGFDAIAALPIADDEIADDDITERIVAAVSGGNRMGASQGGGSLANANVSGGTRIQVGS